METRRLIRCALVPTAAAPLVACAAPPPAATRAHVRVQALSTARIRCVTHVVTGQGMKRHGAGQSRSVRASSPAWAGNSRTA